MTAHGPKSTTFRASLFAAALLALLAAASAQAVTQRVALGQGGFTAPKGSWKATAVPFGSILIDVFDAGGNELQTYGKATGEMRPKAIEASGFRPGGLPTRHGIVAGATGRQIQKVKVHLKGGEVRTVRTVPSPADWNLSSRLFALGFTVPASYKGALRVVIEIEGLNAAGEPVATLRRIPTGAY